MDRPIDVAPAADERTDATAWVAGALADQHAGGHRTRDLAGAIALHDQKVERRIIASMKLYFAELAAAQAGVARKESVFVVDAEKVATAMMRELQRSQVDLALAINESREPA